MTYTNSKAKALVLGFCTLSAITTAACASVTDREAATAKTDPTAPENESDASGSHQELTAFRELVRPYVLGNSSYTQSVDFAPTLLTRLEQRLANGDNVQQCIHEQVVLPNVPVSTSEGLEKCKSTKEEDRRDCALSIAIFDIATCVDLIEPLVSSGAESAERATLRCQNIALDYRAGLLDINGEEVSLADIAVSIANSCEYEQRDGGSRTI